MFSSYVIHNLLYRNSKKIEKEKVKKVLVVSLDYIGDNILSSPVFPVIKENFPNASIWIMVGEWTKDIYRAHPYVDRIVSYNCAWLNRGKIKWGIKKRFGVLLGIYKEKFDLIIDIRGSFGTLFLALLKASKYRADLKVLFAEDLLKRFRRKFLKTRETNFLDIRKPYQVLDIFKYLGIFPDDKPEVSVYIPEEDRKNLKDILIKKGVDLNQQIVVFCPGNNNKFKLWQNEKWAKIGDLVIEKYGAQLVISGSKHDGNAIQNIISFMKHRPINLAGISLMEEAELLNISKLCVCLDSGPMHIAGALKTPLVGLFGMNSPDICAPWTDKSILVYHRLSCSASCEENDEMNCNAECMKAISFEEVSEAVEHFLVKRTTYRVMRKI